MRPTEHPVKLRFFLPRAHKVVARMMSTIGASSTSALHGIQRMERHAGREFEIPLRHCESLALQI
jgi:hypothetical protein